MATLYSILAGNIPWTEESGELQSMGSQRIRHDLATQQQQQSPCKDLIILHHPTSFLSNTVWIFNHRQSCVIICHKTEGKPLMNGDLITHYFVFHIPKHWMRPKQSAQGTRVAFETHPSKFSYSPLLPQTSRLFPCFPQKQQLWSPTTQERGIQSLYHVFYLQIIQDNLSFQHKPSKSFTWETSFNKAFCWNDKSPVTLMLSVSCLLTKVLTRFPITYNDLYSCQVRTFEPCPSRTLFNTLHFR